MDPRAVALEEWAKVISQGVEVKEWEKTKVVSQQRRPGCSIQLWFKYKSKVQISKLAWGIYSFNRSKCTTTLFP